MMDIMNFASAHYTLLGILQMDDFEKTDFFKRKVRSVRPVIAIPELKEEDLKKVIDFERSNEIIKSKVRGVLMYRKAGH
jgi:hypothetical protein